MGIGLALQTDVDLTASGRPDQVLALVDQWAASRTLCLRDKSAICLGQTSKFPYLSASGGLASRKKADAASIDLISHNTR